mmetsp:Transcript_1174/g.2460  ORF Transcript_1174/g.2460 Transcript_1174/m.2460 type:complete len:92 (+) Transcript_1174:110-385(+)
MARRYATKSWIPVQVISSKFLPFLLTRVSIRLNADACTNDWNSTIEYGFKHTLSRKIWIRYLCEPYQDELCPRLELPSTVHCKLSSPDSPR